MQKIRFGNTIRRWSSTVARYLGDDERMATRSAPRIMHYDPWLDSYRRYLTDGTTPSKLATLLSSIDQGDVAAACELQEEIEAKDAHIQSVAARRREALTALDWTIQPEIDSEDASADEVATYCEKQLRKLPMWATTLEHLATAIGPGIAVTELLWRAGELIETVDVPGDRLTCDPAVSNRVRVTTGEDLVEGVMTYSPGFIVHTPTSRAGYPLRVTLVRATAFLWIAKHFAMSDWTAFCEIFGQPVRLGYYDEGVSPEARSTMEDMLKNMGSDCWGLFPRGTEVELLEAARGTEPFSTLVEKIDAKLSILYLGQTLTTEAGPIGTQALGRVHENVSKSINVSDAKTEARTIRNQVLAPMVQLHWPGQRKPVPYFHREVVSEINLEERRLRLEELRFAKELGMRMDPAWLFEELDIPQPPEGELIEEPEVKEPVEDNEEAVENEEENV